MTREMNVKDSIRQGGVLCVVEYANLIDEIAKQIKHENTGKKHYQRHITDRVSPMDG